MIAIILVVCFFEIRLCEVDCNPEPGTPVNEPFGREYGIHPGRVVWSHNPKSTSWDGLLDNYFWEEKNTNQSVVDVMFDKIILGISQNGEDLRTAWNEIFEDFNKRRNSSGGYVPGEKVSIKINLNNQMLSYNKNNYNQLTPQFLKSLLNHLVNIVGVKQEDITVYDASRLINEFFIDAPQGVGQDFPNIQYRDNKGGKPYTKMAEPDESSYLQFSSEKVPHYKETKLPKCLTDSKYLFLVDNFRGHDLAGITESAKNFFGSIYRKESKKCWFFKAGHWCPGELHPFIIAAENPMGSFTPLVDLLGHDEMGQKVVLFLVDGLYSGVNENIKMYPVRWKSPPFNDDWTSSLFASQDPIALDSVLFDFIRNEPNIPFGKHGCVDNYMHEAAKLPNPPSGTVYNPTGKKVLSSLGCHEHWNNNIEKQYSRNLGKDVGIELVKV